jgi:hypothetical protein
MLPVPPHPLAEVGVAVTTMVFPAHASVGGGLEGSGELLLQDGKLIAIIKLLRLRRNKACLVFINLVF